jgi:hypothetical protein
MFGAEVVLKSSKGLVGFGGMHFALLLWWEGGMFVAVRNIRANALCLMGFVRIVSPNRVFGTMVMLTGYSRRCQFQLSSEHILRW